MNRLSMDLSELNLNMEPQHFDEETWLMQIPSPSKKENALIGDERPSGGDEDLDEWLEGAMKKVDFRTRSALTRRLEKKRQKHEVKDRGLLGNHDPQLARIEEVSGESPPSNGRQASSTMRMKGGNIPASKSMNVSNSAESHTHLTPRTVQEEVFITPREHHHQNVLSPLSAIQMESGCDNHHHQRSPRNSPHTANTSVNLSPASTTTESHMEAVDHLMNLGEIERRAREQEQELRRELLSKRDRLLCSSSHGRSEERRLSTQDLHIDANHSRPNSSSSNTSSPFALIATSKSVDFRQTNLGHSGSSNDSYGCNGDVREHNGTSLTSQTPLNSRLPLPRRPMMAGQKTNIPIPVSAKTSRASIKEQSSLGSASTPRSSTMSVHFNDDDECF